MPPKRLGHLKADQLGIARRSPEQRVRNRDEADEPVAGKGAERRLIRLHMPGDIRRDFPPPGRIPAFLGFVGDQPPCAVKVLWGRRVNFARSALQDTDRFSAAKAWGEASALGASGLSGALRKIGSK